MKRKKIKWNNIIALINIITIIVLYLTLNFNININILKFSIITLLFIINIMLESK